MELNFFFFFLAISLFISSLLCNGSDTISAGESLFPNQTIISKEGKFELGFFSPENSSNYFVGIWYKNIPVRTMVWVANRNQPIQSSFYHTSRLEMNNGSLNLIVKSETIWVLAESAYATEAAILETGNFVLRNDSSILWQSFENPTDSWLPRGMVGYRWSTSSTEAKLVSWRSMNDPANGDYSLGMEPNGGSELFIKNNGSNKVWRSGVLQGGTFTSLSSVSDSYKFSFVSVENNVYFTYNVYNESMLVRIVLDYLGFMKHYVWSEVKQEWIELVVQPSDSCNTYARCGPNAVCSVNFSPVCQCLDGFAPIVERDWAAFDFSAGCRRIRPLKCDEENPRFMEVSSVSFPAYAELLEVRRDGVCELVCRVNCSCSAYGYGDGGGCLLFTGELLDLESLPESSGRTLYVRMNMEDPRKGKRKVVLVSLVASITTAMLICIFCICYLWQNKLKSKESRGARKNILLLDLNRNGAADDKCAPVRNSQVEELSDRFELPIFSFSSIAASTNNFSTMSKLGEGGFGPVYKGELPNKQFVAVKKLSRKSGQGLEEFKNEIELIANLQHRNLVRIVGCCVENDEKILVYEYMPNKSLDFFLFDPSKKARLSWRRRVHIIEGIAQGILYLHHYSRLRIVHRDLKASNILLDAEMNAKISDFGMARIFGGDHLQGKTKRIVGTYGYMSPEYATKGLFSVKSDVFAFGVLMLEIISGKKNSGFYGSDCLSLLEYAWNMWKYGLALELIDSTLETSISSSSAPLRCIHIALLCVEENPADRPLMSDVLAMLNNQNCSIATPQHPAFTVGRSLPRVHPMQNEGEVCSVNGLTVSHMEAR